MVKILAGIALLLALSIGPAAGAATVTSTMKRVYVSNDALAIHLTAHPAGCPWGIIASEQDSAYDRWISLAMLAFAEQPSVTVDYDAATCKLTALAVGTPP